MPAFSIYGGADSYVSENIMRYDWKCRAFSDLRFKAVGFDWGMAI